MNIYLPSPMPFEAARLVAGQLSALQTMFTCSAVNAAKTGAPGHRAQTLDTGSDRCVSFFVSVTTRNTMLYILTNDHYAHGNKQFVLAQLLPPARPSQLGNMSLTAC